MRKINAANEKARLEKGPPDIKDIPIHEAMSLPLLASDQKLDLLVTEMGGKNKK